MTQDNTTDKKTEVLDEIASRSELTNEDAEELSKKLKHDIVEHYKD